MYNVLLLDDDLDALNILDSFFPRDRFHTFLEQNISGAKKTLEKIQPDLVVSDIVLASGESGFDFVKYIKSVKLDPVVMLLTGHDYIKGALAYDSDVHLFFRKPIACSKELVAAAMRYLRERPSQDFRFTLSKREREIVAKIAEGKTSSDISIDLGISPRTVSKHRENMLRRSGAKNIVDLMVKVRTRESRVNQF